MLGRSGRVFCKGRQLITALVYRPARAPEFFAYTHLLLSFLGISDKTQGGFQTGLP